MTVVLITGVTGQDGSLLASRLLSDGHEVHGLVLHTDRLPDWAVEGLEKVTVHRGDLADATRVAEVVSTVRPSEIYNLGGQSSVAASWSDPVATALATGVGAAAVFEAAHTLQESTGEPVRIVQASSAEIFGKADVSPQDENTPIRPASPYGAAKAWAHHLAGVYRDRGLFAATCILYNHESTRRPTTFVTRKITAAAARIAVDGGGMLTLGNLDAARDWGWAPDYVDALTLAIRHEVPDDFVIATGRTHTVEEFVRRAFERAGVDDWKAHVEVDQRFVRPAEAVVQVGNATKASELLGWRPVVSFEDLVSRMVDHDLELARATPSPS